MQSHEETHLCNVSAILSPTETQIPNIPFAIQEQQFKYKFTTFKLDNQLHYCHHPNMQKLRKDLMQKSGKEEKKEEKNKHETAASFSASPSKTKFRFKPIP